VSKTICYICGAKRDFLELSQDPATRMMFCIECGREARKEFNTLFEGNYNLANWLRAIANVMDRRKG